MTFVDLLKEIWNSSKERFKTPISGAFLYSFIIFNWRPIVLLLFSKSSIENKIIVINHEYCNFWAIFLPVVIATFYTLLLPKIMLLIESDLAPTKAERVTKRYAAKKHLVEQKTTVASLEFILKNAESGNKEIEELLGKIEELNDQNATLRQSISQITESNNKTVEELNKQLRISTNTITKLQLSTNAEESKDRLKFSKFPSFLALDTLHLESKLANEINSIGTEFTFDDFMFLKDHNWSFGEETSFTGSEKTRIGLASLASKKLITFEESKQGYTAQLTSLGLIFYDSVKLF